MDIKKYIASGILELYVLGLVSEAERKEIYQYIVQYPEIRQELESIEKALEVYAEGSKLKAPEGLEQSILKEIENTPRLISDDQISKRSNSWLPYLLGALLLGALILLWFLNSEYDKTQSSLLQQQNVYQQLEEDCNDKDEELEQLNDQIEILINAHNRRIDMNGENALASVFYNTDTKKSYLNIGTLSAAPAGKNYELWALVAGQPVSMGVFAINPNSDAVLIEVPFVEHADAFAVTLELPDGNPAPNLDELVVISS